MLLLTLRGTPTLYQGDEIGIGEVTIPADRVRDPQDLRQPGLGIGRDRSRTPIPWDRSAYAGFSRVEPWLPLNEDCRVRNIAAQDRDTSSLLSLYRSLLALRRSHDALAIGDFTLVDAAEDVLAYLRRHAGECLLIALNLSDQIRPLSLSQSLPTNTCVADVLASTLLPSTLLPSTLRPSAGTPSIVAPSNLAIRPLDAALAPDEGLVLRLKDEH
jgi:oligo-1,6-glucosidase/alpha-glucosidase